jgi:hypothetical protein
MTSISMPDITATQLAAAAGPVSVTDSAGRVLGYFLPAQAERTQVIFGAKSPFSREELERRYREGAATARPFGEFLEELKAKYPDKFT